MNQMLFQFKAWPRKFRRFFQTLESALKLKAGRLFNYNKFVFLGASKETLPPHFCVLPWTHVFITQTGDVSPCSRVHESFSYGNLHKKSLKQIWQSRRVKSFRQIMLNKTIPHVCRYCNEMEKAGNYTYRDYENANFKVNPNNRRDVEERFINQPKDPISVELRFSNICNLRCRTCSFTFSTSWYEETALIYGSKPTDKIIKSFKNNDSFKQFLNEQLQDIKSIQILGGEPLIHDEFYELLEKLIELKKTDIRIMVTTNLTHIKYKKWNFLQMAQYFSDLNISISIDGIGKQAEYIRKGLNWEHFEKNLRMAVLVGNFKLSIYPAVSVLNAFHLTEALGYLVRKRYLSADTNLAFNAVILPEHYSIQMLNSLERENLKNHYKLFLEDLKQKVSEPLYLKIENYLQGILSLMNNKEIPDQREAFKRLTKILDESRQEKLTDVFPELSSLYT